MVASTSSATAADPASPCTTPTTIGRSSRYRPSPPSCRSSRPSGVRSGLVRVRLGLVPVRMRVDVVAVGVGVRRAPCPAGPAGGATLSGTAGARRQVHEPQHDEHQAHRQLERKAHPRRDDPAEQDDPAADDQDRQGVAQPQSAPISAAPAVVRCRETMVATATTWSGSVACRMPRKNPSAQDGQEARHGTPVAAAPARGAPPGAPPAARELVHPLAAPRRHPEHRHARAAPPGCCRCAASQSNPTAAARSVLVITRDVGAVEDGRILERLVLALGDRQQHQPQILAEVVGGRADQVADVLDEQEVERRRRPSPRARARTIAASRWQTVPVVICLTGAPLRASRAASFSVARSPTSAATRIARVEQRQGPLEERGLARPRTRHEVDDEHAGLAEPVRAARAPPGRSA